MTDDSLFFRTAELSNVLKQLKSEERMLSTSLRGSEGYETTADHTSDRSASHIDASQQSVDVVERLKELRIEIWATTVELETLFFELSKSEFARLESFVETAPGHDLGAVCSAAVHAVAARYVQNFGSLLSNNNNVAHLLVQFSSHLNSEDQSGRSRAVTNRPDVTILRDEAGPRCRGIRVNNQEVRFIDVEMALDEFQSRVRKAVEDWKEERLVRVARRAELRKQLRG